ncbi:TetR/AcrR family transcriptional regulator [Streptomyces asoensis]|uniref:TetR family transcriptional regulator n=1 Tax=Streptomyces asoensis TaxID=249586 RepID=A0ABQ3RXC2_9ACTN|nr:TetR/AcrR family transcriptional regulator [Streptomyces asoensis]GGQ52522.1 TetR family transcriptional regulator [Streptomyces asoensis]GHI60435.1 TetR family transcriptional regulator [Streptomyces asoensis]
MTQDAVQDAQKPAEAGPPPRRRRGRGRRPAAEVRSDVLDAAGGLLLDAGMGSFTIEAVAERAGVSKTTLYKWWPSKGALALDGYFHAVESALAFPDTGDLRADLTAQLRAFVRILTLTPAGRVIAELIGQAQTDPELSAALLERYSGPRRDLAVLRMRGAQAEGRLRPDVDPEVVVDQLWGACYHRLLLPNLPVDEDFADSLVANLWRGIGT